MLTEPTEGGDKNRLSRVNICGTSGSGKTTLGKKVAAILGVPFYELDAFHHLPNWQERPVEEFRQMVEEATSISGWVVDGNYSKGRDIVWSKVQVVVWLDYPLPTVLWRLTGRIMRRGLRREVLWNGNRESLWRHFFTKDSLYVWVFATYRRRRADFLRLSKDPQWSHVRFVRLASAKAAEEWLKTFLAHSQG